MSVGFSPKLKTDMVVVVERNYWLQGARRPSMLLVWLHLKLVKQVSSRDSLTHAWGIEPHGKDLANQRPGRFLGIIGRDPML